jgi:predicted DNA-binding transcriptional regulator AlpA
MQSSQPPAELWRGLLAAKQVCKTVNISRSYWDSLVKAGKAPAPALRIGSRYTRWLASDIQLWLSDPQRWANSNTGARPTAPAESYRGSNL